MIDADILVSTGYTEQKADYSIMKQAGIHTSPSYTYTHKKEIITLFCPSYTIEHIRRVKEGG